MFIQPMPEDEHSAASFALRAHGDQRDKSGEPYFLHPARVAIKVHAAGGKPRQVVAAHLHDVVEDTSVTLDEIRETFGPTVAELVDALTHRPDETNRDYISRVAECPDAVLVKLCDLHDNLDPARIGAARSRGTAGQAIDSEHSRSAASSAPSPRHERRRPVADVPQPFELMIQGRYGPPRREATFSDPRMAVVGAWRRCRMHNVGARATFDVMWSSVVYVDGAGERTPLLEFRRVQRKDGSTLGVQVDALPLPAEILALNPAEYFELTLGPAGETMAEVKR